jgi:RNA polymerase sigma-70 factor, ECF subfamily
MDYLETVRKARKGDAEAFSRLVRERKEDIYRIAYSYVKNRDDALDIVSDAIYKAFVSVRKLKEPEYFNTWFTRILINCANDYLKKSRRVVPMVESIDLSQESNGSEDIMDLYSAIDKLEDKQKTVIILKYLNDLTITEVADILKMPVGTVKTVLHKALRELRLELKEDE